ncbi:MAG: cation diffusion facilitator family transporter [Sulfurimonas sp.]|jgi:cation diffusion facilitator family transporter|uniref:cation diffusion facilitator family transporter n=1 Tax=unclassified Sulfurimonas TaxID=2623549 RepID=UPI0008C917B5|nr:MULTISPECIES: cation diffusion facilitator family transporter [unclassified Sulfurimonas]MDO8260587.1 cation diffusion facilitator family transporter [Candidatus Magasanikbacteria bacterium]OHE12484.1 MAG: cation transporter [Sulfurimonas sp. RIFOXYC2_FULL_36_7]MBS4068508.1 cation transporter [Sulfurimonas sp.]MDD3854944.1 cation diffusion facilitator family transporter [Sulfurimonas sp.]MDX9757175.1 cation diffusion facilitator family transporter [Sulfurimonas sp.]
MRLEKNATLVSTSVASLLVVMKMSIGILSGSIAVLASAIDSLLDLIVSLFNYFALHNAEKDPDDNFNYGRSKIEPLAAVVEGVVISLSALFILYEALLKIAHPREMDYMSESIVVMLLSIIITSLLVLFLNSVAKKTGNMVIRADALHYKTDIFSNGSVLLALGLVSFTGEELIDPILGVGIGIYMIYSAMPIIKEGILMLLDAALSQEDIKKITDIIESKKETTNYHNLQTRESGSHIFISVHVVFNVSISLYDAHLISDKLEIQLKGLFKNKKVHVLIHMDPYDDSEINEMEETY